MDGEGERCTPYYAMDTVSAAAPNSVELKLILTPQVYPRRLDAPRQEHAGCAEQDGPHLGRGAEPRAFPGADVGARPASAGGRRGRFGEESDRG